MSTASEPRMVRLLQCTRRSRGIPVPCNRCMPFEMVRLDCSTCGGKGTVGETVCGHFHGDPEAPCPDCKP